MGGIGKTALALVIAEKVKDRFPDGQIFIEMKGTSKNPLKPAETMANVIRAYLPTAQMPEDLSSLGGLYRSVLSGKHTLILLDNAANREQVEMLLPPTGCAMLITSRQKFTLPGLKAQNMELLPPPDSRDLLLSIANRIGDQADNLANLCGYLPIALRNAASLLAERIDVDVVEYAQKLKDANTRLDLVDATFSLSYELLPPNLQKQWSMLSVFPADFDRAGAAAVWEIDIDAGAKALSDLVKWSLLNFNPNGERYRLHDLARDFAGSRLEAASGAVAQQRHAKHYKNALSAFDELYMKGGSSVLAAMQLFDLEEANIMAGHAWAKKNLEANSSAAELCRSYPDAGVYVLDLRLHPRQKISWLESGVEAARRLKDRAAEGAHLGNLGLAYAALGDAKKAIEFHEQALVIDREIGDRRGEGNALFNLSLSLDKLGQRTEAIDCARSALKIYELIESPNAERVRQKLAKWKG
jgi:tetratricopeptide (TPR) repeat protein